MKHKPQMMKMRWLSAAVMLSLCTSSAWAFSIDDVAKEAQTLAGKGFEAPKSNLPSAFRDMKYADYQQIQFNHDKAYWNNLKSPFKLEFYHQGMYFDTPVTINEVTATSVRKIKYNPDYFNFGNVQHDKDTVKDLGFAGFKVLYPINSKDTSACSARVRYTGFLPVGWRLIPHCRPEKSSRVFVNSGLSVLKLPINV